MISKSLVVLIFAFTASILYGKFSFSAIQSSSVNSSAFAVPSNDYVVVKSETIAQKNLPPVHPQDALPVCCSEAARTLFLQYQCNFVAKTSCENYPNSLVPSVLSMSAISYEAQLDGRPALKKNDPIPVNVTLPMEYILHQLNMVGTTLPETCFPFDQFVAQFHTGNMYKDVEAAQKAFMDLKAKFESVRLQSLESVCTACLDELFNSLNAHFAILGQFTKDDATQLQDAVKENTFERFLHKVLLGKCTDKLVPFNQPPTFSWPENTSERPANYSDSIKEIKKHLSENNSLGMTMCPYSMPKGTVGQLECEGGIHCIVITGYEKACKSDGKCIDLVRVHNSWGTDWQKLNNDGWVDAKTLIDHADLGRSSQLLYFKHPTSD